MKNLADRNVLLPLWLGSAAVVTVVRFFQPADPGYDLGLQLQAAHNLLAGRGLATYAELGPNLSHPNVLVPLTYFPAGYSLAAAALSSAGLGVGMTLKVLGAAATMLGWWGWARLAQSFIGEGRHASALEMGRDRDCGLRSAVVHPAVGRNRYFPVGRRAVGDRVHGQGIEREHAQGLEVRLARRNALRVCMPDAVCERVSASATWCASSCGSRDCGSGNCSIDRSRSESVCCRRFMLQGYLNYFRPQESAVMPGGLFTAHASVFSRLEAGIPIAAQRELPVGILDSGQDCRSDVPCSRRRVPVADGAAARGRCAAYCSRSTMYRSGLKLTARDSRVVALGLFPAIPLFLWGCMTLSAANYLGDLRYFWPVIPLSVLVAYSIASIRDVSAPTCHAWYPSAGCRALHVWVRRDEPRLSVLPVHAGYRR